jgi:nickel transport protein
MPEKRIVRNRSRRGLWFRVVGLILAIGVLATPALAHRMLVFAYAEGDIIHTESKFVPDTPVRGGQLTVQEPKTGRVLLTGATDAQGKFSFKIPAEAAAQRFDLQIVVDAGMGHRGAWLLKAENYLAGVQPEPAATPAPAAAPTPATPGTDAAVDQQLLEDVLNAALERQLAPVKEQLAQITVQRTALTDIIGGIGYIMGLFGLWAYFLSRRKKNS